MNQNNKKKLILATGIFPPDVGGPSTYVFELAKRLLLKSYVVNIVAYGDEKFPTSNFQFPNNFQLSNNQFSIDFVSRQQNIIFRYLKYFWAVFKNEKNAEAVFTFDLTSSGLPAFLGAILRRKKTIVRMGGDALWEKAFSSGLTNLPLEKYYKQKKSLKEKIIFVLNKLLINRFSQIVFTNDWMKKIYLEFYKVKSKKSVVVKNPYPNLKKNEENLAVESKRFIFAGRLIKLKNLDRVIKVVSSIPEIKLDIYGEGPEKDNLKTLVKELGVSDRVSVKEKLAHKDFMNELQNSYVAIVPAITEVSPNTVLECIKLGVPVLATKECGLYDDYKDDLIFIDPMDADDIRKKFKLVLKKDVYEAYKGGLSGIDTAYGFDDVAEKINKIITN